jgi:predicted DNA-binding transcriptional regulator YafY
MASRAFELSELKLLVDAVQASKVISARTSKKLIRKLEALCSEYEGTQLQRQVYVDGRPKADSRTLLYSIDALHSAINAGRMVRFRYKDDGTRTVSPWQLAWENGCYYLIAYQDEKEPAGIRNYRVDRMSSVTVLGDARRGKAEFRQFDLPAYLRKHFNMFGGPEYRVTLRCTADLEAAMRDRFGQDTLFLPEADGYFHFDVPVCVSDQFYGWVCGFGGKVEVTSPAEVRQGLHDMVQELAEQHN